MELPEHNELEKFIHAQLQMLPEREAPEALVSNVLAAIAKHKKLPWWKQSFTFWPRHIQNMFFVALASVFLLAIYLSGRAADNVTVPDVSAQLSSYAWVGRTLRTIGETVFVTVSNLPLQYFVGFAMVFMLLYGACLAAGFALFKVTSSARSSFDMTGGSQFEGTSGSHA
jgi:hypothetical protein